MLVDEITFLERKGSQDCILNSKDNLYNSYATSNENNEPFKEIGDDTHENLSLNFTNAMILMRTTGWYFLNIFLIYFTQYCCVTIFADVYSTKLK